jgi:hypothetical protein
MSEISPFEVLLVAVMIGIFCLMCTFDGWGF